jgi:hypothetical protein
MNEGLVYVCSNCRHINGDCKDYMSMENCKLKNVFKKSWDSRYAKDGFGWKINPLVWVFSIEKTEKPLSFLVTENKKRGGVKA